MSEPKAPSIRELMLAKRAAFDAMTPEEQAAHVESYRRDRDLDEQHNARRRAIAARKAV